MVKITGMVYPTADDIVDIQGITDNFHKIANSVCVIPYEHPVTIDKDGWGEKSYDVETGIVKKTSNYKPAGFHLAKIKLPNNQGVSYSYVLASPLVEDTGENMEMLRQMGYCGVELVAHTKDIINCVREEKYVYLLFRARNSIPTVDMKFMIVFI